MPARSILICRHFVRTETATVTDYPMALDNTFYMYKMTTYHNRLGDVINKLTISQLSTYIAQPANRILGRYISAVYIRDTPTAQADKQQLQLNTHTHAAIEPLSECCNSLTGACCRHQCHSHSRINTQWAAAPPPPAAWCQRCARHTPK